jgi:hypothetical protein
MPAFDEAALKAAVLKRLQGEHADPVAAVPEKKGIGAAPYLALVGGHVADAATTLQALKRPGTEEANPLLNGFGPTGIALKGGSALLQALLMRKLANSGHPTAAKALGYGIGAGMGALAARNSQVGKK